MTDRHTNRRQHRQSFRETLDSERCNSRKRLAAKAKLANQLAKTAIGKASRAVAYATKTAALEQGLRLGFKLRGDELARPGLAVVNTGSHGLLHVRLSMLSPDLFDRPEFHVRLCGSAARPTEGSPEQH